MNHEEYQNNKNRDDNKKLSTVIGFTIVIGWIIGSIVAANGSPIIGWVINALATVLLFVTINNTTGTWYRNDD